MTKIIPATIDDIDYIFYFVSNLWDYNSYTKETLLEELKSVLNDPNSFLFFLNNGDKNVGFCHGIMFHTFWMSGKTCYISGLMTIPECRGKGYGIKLMEHAKKIAKDAHCKALILDSGCARTDAHRFYENYGFEKSCYGFELML